MIHYIEQNRTFILATDSTEYALCVREDGHLEHLYYGARTGGTGLFEALRDRSLFETGNAIVCGEALVLESLRQEVSSCGKGDISDPFVQMVHANGSRTCDFVYESHEIKEGRDELAGLPSAYENGESVSQLTITLKDADYGQRLDIVFVTFDSADVITRSARLTNESESAERLERLMSMQLDIADSGWKLIHFGGAWAREMHMHETPLSNGRVVNSSVCGTSSSRANPFVMVAENSASENYGECYGINLVYSGNHYESCDINAYGRLRVLSGICPDNFEFVLEPGESFQAPEAVMTYSDTGYAGVSAHMHRFVRKHIVRGCWADKERPILLNSWEAAYFDIDEKKLLKLAKQAADCGIELFVMDDGWFGHRDDDTSSLGDWKENRKKLPGGVKRLAQKVNELGLDFGIWVEPEMISEDSDLYRAHPDWAVRVPGQSHALGRHQMLLDYTRAEVREYIISAMTEVFSSAHISYVKWDMNRIMSDCYSTSLSENRQGEFAHRYVLGLYEVMGALTQSFPEILFEGCAAGGNRFDLGILCYMPQIWASDDTDAAERVRIQTGYSYGYPMSTVSAHVSGCPNHQTLRVTPLETRFNVAAFGVLGYECNLCDMKKKDIEAVKEQIGFYKKHRRTLQFGEYHRIRSGGSSETERDSYQFVTVSPDANEVVACWYSGQTIPNYTARHLSVAGLDDGRSYRMTNRQLTYSVKLLGDLVNTASPVHVKPDSLTQQVLDTFMKLSGEKEDVTASGAVFNRAGVNLAPCFAGTGYNDQTALCPDYSSRVYVFEAV